MRNRRNNDDRNQEPEADPRWLHEQQHGHNSTRGNYTVDSHFNRGYGEYDGDYLDRTSFNTNPDRSYNAPERYNPAGGAQYTGDDFIGRRRSRRDNMYGMNYIPDDGYNSGRHYDARANYKKNRDYEDLRRESEQRERRGWADERFGHEVGRRGRNESFTGHTSPGDYESYRRYEMGNPSYDNDYSGGFAGRTYTEGSTHYGEGNYYSNLDQWRHEEQARNAERPARGKRNK